jgi:bifunctional non-homologous end joining protein LigD
MKPLAEYRRKRNFRVTSEPGAKRPQARKKNLTFVVQEHHASHLHYDFRLEWDGVLKSWAVPKGPSLDPAQRRLAVQVEDHPLAYAKFTGTIPKGEYGAGEVFRWDMGHWTPENDPTDGLKSGRLEFRLQGHKLKGDWLLVRTRARSGSKAQWLLIKRHDRFAKDTGLSETKSSTKSSTRKPDKEPDFIPPQLALLGDHVPSGKDWVHEIKFDGYRIQAHVQNKKVHLLTRKGLDWTEKYQSIADDLMRLGVTNAILDGEVTWQDANGRSDFQGLQNAMRAGDDSALAYWVFDLLFLNGKDLTSLPLMARKDRLEKLIARLKSKRVRYSEHIRESGDKFLTASCGMNLEGIISKRLDQPYHPGRRTDDWIKSKCTQRQEFVIGGYSEPTGSRSDFGALLLGIYTDSGKLRYVGRVGTGFSSATLRDLGKKLQRLKSRTSPFTEAEPSSKNVHWVKPQLVAEVSFSEWTKDRILRVPVFHGLRLDKPAREIGIEKKQSKKQKKPQVTETATADFTVTHPDRLIYKTEKLSKKDVADYYAKVSDRLMPHISGRPLALVRCPQGATGACFFSKHFATRLPDHVLPVPQAKGSPFIKIEEAEGLHQLVQYNALEIHPWNAHDPDRPDQIVLDFDPDPSVAFQTVIDGTL